MVALVMSMAGVALFTMPLHLHNIYRKKFIEENGLGNYLVIRPPAHTGVVFDFVSMRVFLINEAFEKVSKSHMPGWMKPYRKFYRKITYNPMYRMLSFFIKSKDAVIREQL